MALVRESEQGHQRKDELFILIAEKKAFKSYLNSPDFVRRKAHICHNIDSKFADSFISRFMQPSNQEGLQRNLKRKYRPTTSPNHWVLSLEQ